MFLCLMVSLSNSPMVLSSLDVVSLDTFALRPSLGSFLFAYITIWIRLYHLPT